MQINGGNGVLLKDFVLGNYDMKRKVIIDRIRLSPEEAKKIIDEAVESAAHTTSLGNILSFGALIVVFFIAIFVAVWLASGLGLMFSSRSPWAGLWICITYPSAAVLICFIYHPLMRFFHRKEIRAEMSARGFELCPTCGYWLKGLGADSSHCPECGTQTRYPREAASERSEDADQ